MAFQDSAMQEVGRKIRCRLVLLRDAKESAEETDKDLNLVNEVEEKQHELINKDDYNKDQLRFLEGLSVLYEDELDDPLHPYSNKFNSINQGQQIQKQAQFFDFQPTSNDSSEEKLDFGYDARYCTGWTCIALEYFTSLWVVGTDGPITRSFNLKSKVRSRELTHNSKDNNQSEQLYHGDDRIKHLHKILDSSYDDPYGCKYPSKTLLQIWKEESKSYRDEYNDLESQYPPFDILPVVLSGKCSNFVKIRNMVRLVKSRIIIISGNDEYNEHGNYNMNYKIANDLSNYGVWNHIKFKYKELLRFIKNKFSFMDHNDLSSNSDYDINDINIGLFGRVSSVYINDSSYDELSYYYKTGDFLGNNTQFVYNNNIHSSSIELPVGNDIPPTDFVIEFYIPYLLIIGRLLFIIFLSPVFTFLTLYLYTLFGQEREKRRNRLSKSDLNSLPIVTFIGKKYHRINTQSNDSSNEINVIIHDGNEQDVVYDSTDIRNHELENDAIKEPEPELESKLNQNLQIESSTGSGLEEIEENHSEEEEEEEEEVLCGICLEPLIKNESLIRILNQCNHNDWHKECIDQWLLNEKRICPLCKKDVITGIEYKKLEIINNTENQINESELIPEIENETHELEIENQLDNIENSSIINLNVNNSNENNNDNLNDAINEETPLIN